jgi:DNA-binding GntR family transcriptional regulator
MLSTNLYERALRIGIKACQNKTRLLASFNEHLEIINALENSDEGLFLRLVEKNIMNGYISLTGNYSI